MDEKKQIEEMATAICDECRSHTPNCEYIICDSAIESAEAVFAAGYRKQSGWISVDERLPPKREWVICYSPNKKSLPIFLGRMGNYSDVWQQEGGYICMTPVTHWMPLPERPKGE